MVETGAHIEISSSKDQSLTFLVTGKQSDVLDARRKILTNFQTQASRKVSIPKEHHRWILGKFIFLLFVVILSNFHLNYLLFLVISNYI